MWRPEGLRYMDLQGAAPAVAGGALKTRALSYRGANHRCVPLRSRVET